VTRAAHAIDEMTKRLFDLIGSALALVLLSPLFALIALCIKIDSPGPVFFRQTRVGRAGEPFRIFKFRTMYANAAKPGPALTVGADPRITGAGAVLRRLKLDELPQFINVLLGHMSIVGPRPEVPKYVEMYPPETRAIVLSVRPGITDPASIEYRAESAILGRSSDPEQSYIQEIMPAKLRLAVEYVQHASFWRDLAIVWGTVRVLWQREVP
jgi:lipopolysaccharide/colanic/teichoic acid biosynthesis glycosyltransferase